MRVFAAVSIPEELRLAARKAASPLRALGGDVKWTPAEHMHFTLAFLGELSPEQVEGAKAALSAAASKVPAFDAALGRFGAFPDLDAPKVIWVGVSAGGERLSALADALRAQLRAFSLPFDEKPFVPHLTLGRVRRPGGLKALKAKLEHAPGLVGAFRVGEAVLFESKLTAAGPKYEALAAAKLP